MSVLPPSSNDWLNNLKSYGLIKLVDNRVVGTGQEVVDFTIGDPKEPTPAFIIEAVQRNMHPISQYPPTSGLLSLKQACAGWIHRRTSVSLDPATQIISSNGSKEAIFHIPCAILNAHSSRRIVLYPDPGFPVYHAGTALAGGISQHYELTPENQYLFDPDTIDAQLCEKIAALWVSYPHNPTGAEIPLENMKKIYAWALKHNIILLSDECYLDSMAPNIEYVPHSFLEVAQETEFKNLLCLFSLSKRSGMTGYRSGFVAGDKELIKTFSKYRLNSGLGTPEFIQHGAIAAWNDDAHVRERNAIFDAKRKVLQKFFQKNGIQFLPSDTTIYLWAEVPARYASGQEFCKKLLETTGIAATPGDALGECAERHFRLAFVPPLEKIQAILELWQQKIDTGVFEL